MEKNYMKKKKFTKNIKLKQFLTTKSVLKESAQQFLQFAITKLELN